MGVRIIVLFKGFDCYNNVDSNYGDVTNSNYVSLNIPKNQIPLIKQINQKNRKKKKEGAEWLLRVIKEESKLEMSHKESSLMMTAN